MRSDEPLRFFRTYSVLWLAMRRADLLPAECSDYSSASNDRLKFAGVNRLVGQQIQSTIFRKRIEHVPQHELVAELDFPLCCVGKHMLEARDKDLTCRIEFGRDNLCGPYLGSILADDTCAISRK